MTDKYYLKTPAEKKWRKVTKKQFIEAERAAGLYPNLLPTDPNYMKVCATAGFGDDSIEGKIE